MPPWIVERLNQTESTLDAHYADGKRLPFISQVTAIGPLGSSPPATGPTLDKDITMQRNHDEDETRQIKALEAQLLKWHTEKMYFCREKDQLRKRQGSYSMEDEQAKRDEEVLQEHLKVIYS